LARRKVVADRQGTEAREAGLEGPLMGEVCGGGRYLNSKAEYRPGLKEEKRKGGLPLKWSRILSNVRRQ